MNERLGSLAFDYTSGPQRISDEIRRMRSEEEKYKRYLFQQERAGPKLQQHTLAAQGFNPGEINQAKANLISSYKKSPEYAADIDDPSIPASLRADYQMFLRGSANKLEAIDKVLTKYIRRQSLDPALKEQIRNLMSYRSSIVSKYRIEGAFQPTLIFKA